MSKEQGAVQTEEKERDDPLKITLSSGVVLRAKKAKPGALLDSIRDLRRPDPPKVEGKFGLMDNPSDEDYQQDLQFHQASVAGQLLNTFILLGTEIETIPKKMEKPESDDWIEEMEAIGKPTMPHNKPWRYINWVKWVAAETDEDIGQIIEKAGRLAGVSESDVQAVAGSSFRDK